ncbi:MAG: tripartite tricarboxylate transporter substrate binding protein [Burkholderiales bacterium]
MMMTVAKKKVLGALAVFVGLWFSLSVFVVVSAQTYPAKPVRIIVPYPAGGLGDILPRALGASLGEQTGQLFVTENRPGASQMIGAQLAAKAAPDGYTLFFGSVTSLAINVSAQKQLPYDPLRDFAPVSLCFSTPLYLVVNPVVPARSVKELIALVRARPGKLTFASGGPGSSNHLAGELFKFLIGADIVHVPYKGAGPAMVDVIGGHVDMMFEGAGINYAKDGKVRVLAVSSAARSPVAPQLPTMQEAGVPGYESTIWFGIVAPGATPAPIVARLSQEIVKALAQPVMRERLAAVNLIGTTPEVFAAHIRAEIPKWRKVIDNAKIRFE